jgi:hypothetical protein
VGGRMRERKALIEAGTLWTCTNALCILLPRILPLLSRRALHRRSEREAAARSNDLVVVSVNS